MNDEQGSSPCKDGVHDVEFHSPQRNMKRCTKCTGVWDMTSAECWRNREAFEDPTWTELKNGI